jgi:hypothetical protein
VEEIVIKRKRLMLLYLKRTDLRVSYLPTFIIKYRHCMNNSYCEKSYLWIGRAIEYELYKFTIPFDKMKERAPVYREGHAVEKGTIKMMEPTFFVSLEFVISMLNDLIE